MQVQVPDVWKIGSPDLNFKLGPGEDANQDLGVMLRSNASSGTQKLRIDFTIVADKPLRFSVYREIQVGLGDIVVELDTWLDDDGRLIVEQHIANETSRRLNFNCYLFAPGRRRLRMQIFDVGPGRVSSSFSLRNGEELLDKNLWLRVEELKSGGIQNHYVIAKP